MTEEEVKGTRERTRGATRVTHADLRTTVKQCGPYLDQTKSREMEQEEKEGKHEYQEDWKEQEREDMRKA